MLAEQLPLRHQKTDYVIVFSEFATRQARFMSRLISPALWSYSARMGLRLIFPFRSESSLSLILTQSCYYAASLDFKFLFQFRLNCGFIR